MYGLNYDGLKKKPKYNELIDYVMNKQEKIKYPNRTAKFLRESPQLSNLLDGDGEGVLEMEEQQKRQMLAVEIGHAIRRVAGSGQGGSAAELNVNMAQSLGGSQAGGSQAGGSQAEGSQAGGSQAGGSQAGGSQAGGSQAGGSQAGGLPGSSALIQSIDNTLGENAESMTAQQGGYQNLGQDIAAGSTYLDVLVSSTVGPGASQPEEQDTSGVQQSSKDNTGLEDETGTTNEKIALVESAISKWENNTLIYNINQLMLYYQNLIKDQDIINLIGEIQVLTDEGDNTGVRQLRTNIRKMLVNKYQGVEGKKELAELFIKQLGLRVKLEKYKKEEEEVERLKEGIKGATTVGASREILAAAKAAADADRLKTAIAKTETGRAAMLGDASKIVEARKILAKEKAAKPKPNIEPISTTPT